MIAMDSPITFRTKFALVCLEPSSRARSIQGLMAAGHVVQAYEPVSVATGMQAAHGACVRAPWDRVHKIRVLRLATMPTVTARPIADVFALTDKCSPAAPPWQLEHVNLAQAYASKVFSGSASVLYFLPRAIRVALPVTMRIVMAS